MRKKAVLLAASASVASGMGGGKKTFGSTWCAVCLSLKSRRSSCCFFCASDLVASRLRRRMQRKDREPYSGHGRLCRWPGAGTANDPW